MKKDGSMTKNLRIRIFYFSATGNTKYGLLMLKKHLAASGHKCDLISVENESIIEKDDCDLLGFATPVYGGYPAEIMMNFIKRSPHSTSKFPAFTVLCPCSSIGYWGSKEIFADVLNNKNIQVIDELGFLGNPSHPIVVGSMKNASPKLRSFFDGIGRPDSFDEKTIQEFAEGLGSSYHNYFNSGKTKNLGHSAIKVWVSNKMRKKEMRVGIENPITVDMTKCTKCGLCEKGCPTMSLKLNPYPERNLTQCFNCQKCTNLCPQQAFYLKGIEGIGQYKGAFEKIRKMNVSCNYSAEEVPVHKKSWMLRFLSTGVGMVFLMIINKYTDSKVIKKSNTAGERVLS